jgi:type I restriction enzyme S subunit
VEWVGKIPQHWKIKPLKYFSDVFSSSVDRHVYEDELQVSICHYPDVYKNEFINEDVELNKGSCSEVEFERFHLKEGLVILTKDSESPDDIGIPCYVEKNLNNVVCGYHLSIIEKNKNYINSKFLFRFIQSDIVRCHFEVHAKGITRFGLSKFIIENLFVNLPSIIEQQQIVTYLDRKTQKIDELIKKTGMKLELLKEKRTALINHCVTKGLNADVEMKDSGVEWIGEIPSHWTVSKVKYEFLFTGGGTPSKEREDYWNGEIPWISPKDMKSIVISNSQEKITEKGLKNSATTPIDKNSLLIVVRSGILQRMIPIGINSISVTINQDLKSLRSINDYPIKYFYFYIKGNELNLLIDWSKEGTTVESIEMEFMSNSRIPFPPKTEQQQIVEYLDDQTQKIDSAIEKKSRRIGLLKEYRQALISNVVTGKIDVREDV